MENLVDSESFDKVVDLIESKVDKESMELIVERLNNKIDQEEFLELVNTFSQQRDNFGTLSTETQEVLVNIREEFEEFKFNLESLLQRKTDLELFNKLSLQVEKKTDDEEIQSVISAMRGNFQQDLQVLKDSFRQQKQQTEKTLRQR
jgi:hypothetical protein